MESTFPKKVLGHANGELVPDGKEYFNRMGKIGKSVVIHDAPVFDYFYLESFGPKKDWEWRLQDVHGFIGEYPATASWFISDKCKKVLEQFYIAPHHYFYASKLLYKGKRLDYWIFQFPIAPLENYRFEESKFYYEHNNQRNEILISEQEEFLSIRRKLSLEDNIELKCSKITLKGNYDLVYILPSGGRLASFSLRQSIESSGLQGFLFSELDYEVEVSNPSIS